MRDECECSRLRCTKKCVYIVKFNSLGYMVVDLGFEVAQNSIPEELPRSRSLNIMNCQHRTIIMDKNQFLLIYSLPFPF